MKDDRPTLADAGIDEKFSSRAQKLAAVPEEKFERELAALGHGNFERLFAGHKDPVAEPVHCTIGTAERLMKIAGHGIISKSAHGPTLPPSWRTLYELTKVPDDRLEVALLTISRRGRFPSRTLQRPWRTRICEAPRLWSSAPQPYSRR